MNLGRRYRRRRLAALGLPLSPEEFAKRVQGTLPGDAISGLGTFCLRCGIATWLSCSDGLCTSGPNRCHFQKKGK